MSELVRVAVDAMGGDHAPEAVVQGVVDALNVSKEIEVLLVGDQTAIEKCLTGAQYDKTRLQVIHASEVITNNETPTIAIKKKKDSSIVVSQRLVREGKADAFVSAGSTGAVLVGSQVLIGRIRGIERPALAPLIPTTKGFSLLIDCGANVDAKPSNLVQFARMGAIYMEHILGRKNPRVAIVNIGIEEEKGNALVKQTYPLLKECGDINFIGSIEARDIPNGYADVIVCEAFVGNVILKMYEGVAGALMGMVKETMMSSLKTKIGALLIKNELKQTLKDFDASDYGGAPMLGLKGLVVKSHGSSSVSHSNSRIFQAGSQRLLQRTRNYFQLQKTRRKNDTIVDLTGRGRRMANHTLLKELQQKIDYQFKDENLLFTALTHSSYANEHKLHKIHHNERLEFLGDAVLEVVSSDFLFKNFPDMAEGQMSKKRASLVCEPTLAYCARQIGLGKYLMLGKGEDMGGGRNRDSILSDALEAVIGSIYLDGGIEQAGSFIMTHVLNDIEHKAMFQDSKTILQELLQKDHKDPITYEVVDMTGPEHNRMFVMQVKLGDRVIGKGSGRTKQAAGQEAAYHAILALKNKQEH